MKCNRTISRKHDHSAGVSENIGAILLISLVVAGVGVVAIAFFSQTTPSKIPAVNYMTGVNDARNTLYIYHNGGDSLTKGEFSVVLDGVPASYTVADGSTQWSLGKNLVVPITTVPRTVSLVYNGTSTGGGVLLDQSAANIVKTVNVSPDQLPYLDCAAVRNWDCRFQIPPEIIVDRYQSNSTNQRINFMMNNVNNGITGQLSSMAYHFNVTVATANSTIVWGAADCNPFRKVDLTTGDQISVSFDSNSGPDDFIIYGSAPQIWEMAGGLATDLKIIVRFANGTVITADDAGSPGGRLCHTWIDSYSAIDSTMVINGEPVTGAPFTNLVVNQTVYINSGNSSTIKLVNFRPLPNGMFLVSFPGNAAAPVYMIGWADSITINGNRWNGLGV